jgi:SagB-type dehydrogenase family enzyme
MAGLVDARHEETVVATNPFAAIEFEQDESGRHRVRDTTCRRTYLVAPHTAAVLVLAAAPQTVAELTEETVQELGLGEREAAETIDALRQKGLLLESNGDERSTDLATWNRFGWREAHRYHRVTLDYPFYDYTEDRGAFRFDVQRMQGFAAHERDENRAKSYPGAERIRLPQPAEAAKTLVEALERPESALDDALLVLLSLTFGVVGRAYPEWDGAPTFRRTSPSGGGRHPSEAYVAVLSDSRLECGWYHVAVEEPALERLDVPLEADELDDLLPGSVGRADFRVGAAILLTTVFERNMYRYREPRTFRTVHMDVGHLVGTIFMLSRLLRLRARANCAPDPHAVEHPLGLHWLEEGMQYAVALEAA